jgi:PucR family transcriptional regulator, purine catabolism regulatory protein
MVPTLSLQELLRLAFPEPVTWLSGDPDAAGPVSWVAASLEEARPGDLLLLPARALTQELVRNVQSREIAALALLGQPDGSRFDLPKDLPLVCISGEQDTRQAQRLLLTMLIHQRTGLIERGFQIHQQLSQLAMEGLGLEGLARAMSDLSGRGVLVQDKRLKTLAENPTTGLEAIWGEVVVSLSGLDSLPESLRDRKQAGKQPALIQQEIPGGLVRLVTPIRVSDVARGYLSLVGLAGELDALDNLVTEQGALVCAVEMARSKAIREAEKRIQGDLLTALLQESLSPRDARLWVQTMGLDLEQAHVALRFAWDGNAPPSRRRLETLINGEVARLGLKVIVSSMGSEIVCFCQVPPTPGRPELALSLGQAVLNQEEREFTHRLARCGIGAPTSNLGGWNLSFRQAGQALDMARRLDERNPLYFPDLSVYRLLLQIEHNPELIAFQEETLGALLSNESGRDLIHTLEAYFEHNGNLSQTAEALFIHRNTLLYRMERIEEVTHLDLDLPGTRLAVQLALHILKMRGG